MAQVSRAEAARARMSIGEVLTALRTDFPDVSISKIRFLEAEGLVEPERTQAGYRKFSHADVERLRYVLQCQREHYLPLKVIKEHLDAIDRGLEPPEVPGAAPRVPRVALQADGPEPASFAAEPGDLRLTRAELLEAAGVDDALLSDLEAFGLVRARAGSRAPYDADAVLIARTAGALAAYGVEARHLRAFRTAADREIGLVEQVVEPLRRSRDAGAQGRAEEAISQMASLSVKLHAALVRAGLRSR